MDGGTDRGYAVAIVGAGAAGALVAVHLLRAGAERIALVDPGDRVARGVAYSTRFPAHLMNVEARVLGGLSGHPEHFAEWLGPDVSPRAFSSRETYGDYLADLLAAAEADVPPGALDVVRAEVVGLVPAAGGYALALDDGSSIHAAHVVLATGPPPPRDVPLPGGGWPDDPSPYVRNPWAPGALDAIPTDGDVLLVGTGPTTIDVVLELAETRPGLRMTAVSRHGLLPTPHRPSGTLPVDYRLLPAGSSLLEQVRAFRAALADGADARDLVDAMRPDSQTVWKAFDRREQERYLAAYMRLWTVHRTRMPPVVTEWMDALQADGRLEIRAGRLLRVGRGDAGGLDVSIGRRSGEPDRREFAAVINCAGPADSPFTGDSPLYSDLLARGLARPDPLGLGVDAGSLPDSISTIGWLRRGELWESVAIPELRDQAAEIAATVLR